MCFGFEKKFFFFCLFVFLAIPSNIYHKSILTNLHIYITFIFYHGTLSVFFCSLFLF